MKNELEPSKVLSAYETVMENGSPLNLARSMKGLKRMRIMMATTSSCVVTVLS